MQNKLAALEATLSCEERIRSAENETELAHLIVNELRKLTGARQVFVFKAAEAKKYSMLAVSSLAIVDRDTPFVRWIESLTGALIRETGGQKALAFELPAYTDASLHETTSYPFPSMAWQPLQLRTGEVFGGILFTRERPWGDTEQTVIQRQVSNAATAWVALVGVQALQKSQAKRRWLPWAIIALTCVVCAMPVPMTTLAPVEIVAARPHRVTAPLDGVLSELPVPPNQPVKTKDLILRIEDTTLSNKLKVAKQELQVAQAEYDRTRQAAFSDDNARHELAIAKNNLLLKQAERDYASSQLEKTIVRAKRDGVLVYEDRNKLLGRPVQTGESLMEIADPAQIAARIELPVADAIVLETNSLVRLFLDADPLKSLSARLTTKSYKAVPNSTQQLVYRLRAEFDGAKPATRIGARGTAQLTGERVPLIYLLLRRPIAAARQYIGI